MTVNAVETVRVFPLQIYAQKEMMDMATGTARQTEVKAISR
jgi:hypothetical protein